MNHLDADPLLIKFTLDQTRKERDKVVEDLKKSNAKVMKSIEIINMLTSRIDMKKNFTLLLIIFYLHTKMHWIITSNFLVYRVLN